MLVGRTPAEEKILNPRTRTFHAYEEAIFLVHGVRVIFLCPKNTRLPERVRLPFLTPIVDPEDTVIGLYEFLDREVFGTSYVVVTNTGTVNPNGNTKVKNIMFHRPLPKPIKTMLPSQRPRW